MEVRWMVSVLDSLVEFGKDEQFRKMRNGRVTEVVGEERFSVLCGASLLGGRVCFKEEKK